jgi:hypothetical protein
MSIPMTAAVGTSPRRCAATAPAPVQRSTARPLPGEQGRGAVGQPLALNPGGIDAWRHVQRPAAEQDRSCDPCRWLALLPPAEPRLERGLVRSGGNELGRFLGGGDAAGLDEPVDYGREDGIGY